MKRSIFSKLLGVAFGALITLGSVAQANAALLGVEALFGFPRIGADGATGSITYNASTDDFSLSATPTSIILTSGGAFLPISMTPTLTLDFDVDDTGSLTSGSPGLVITGAVPGLSIIVDGTLLTGTVTAFGFEAGATDVFDVWIDITGGTLVDTGNWPDQATGLVMKAVTDFTGGFTTSFSSSTDPNVTLAPAEPTSLLLLGFGLVGLALLGRWKTRKGTRA